MYILCEPQFLKNMTLKRNKSKTLKPCVSVVRKAHYSVPPEDCLVFQ